MPYTRYFKYLKHGSGVYKKPRSSSHSEKEKNKQKLLSHINNFREPEQRPFFIQSQVDSFNEVFEEQNNLNEADLLQSTQALPLANDQNLIFESETSSEVNFSSESICNGLLAVFLAGKLTQSALKLVIDFINIVFATDLPNTFNKISQNLLSIHEEALRYTKRWFCGKCKTFHEIKNETRFKRLCNICKHRYNQ